MINGKKSDEEANNNNNIVSGRVEIYSVGLRNFQEGLRNFRRVDKYSGGLRNLQGGLQFFWGGGWGLGFFGRGWDFSGGVEI